MPLAFSPNQAAAVEQPPRSTAVRLSMTNDSVHKYAQTFVTNSVHLATPHQLTCVVEDGKVLTNRSVVKCASHFIHDQQLHMQM